ncbi:hypothetical protein AC791_19180 [Klebsiella sp. RIT-PI-d]|uniref:hypothetical protein n=1 Tax=Klebsiella sp. RIT-PI-d TaxID=1681196 RepID=UPI0006762B29|nr:hypothetical protein [Klebsiella sp. RIT-PI-d]KNC06068.1 hypothetical protein AC791_19180 [Klebsiella sp. RIT-PI-d]
MMVLRRRITLVGCVLLSLLSGCKNHRINRTVVYENTVYHWRIEHVVNTIYPASTRQYYEVFLNDRLLILPANTFNDENDIQMFIAAGGFDIGHWRNKSIVVSFENNQQREGKEIRLIRSVMLAPEKENEVLVTDMFTGQQVIVQRK